MCESLATNNDTPQAKTILREGCPPPPCMIVGCTNPFFLKLASAWPHVCVANVACSASHVTRHTSHVTRHIVLQALRGQRLWHGVCAGRDTLLLLLLLLLRLLLLLLQGWVAAADVICCR